MLLVPCIFSRTGPPNPLLAGNMLLKTYYCVALGDTGEEKTSFNPFLDRAEIEP